MAVKPWDPNPRMIDYSQYSLWNFCPWAWYERYVNGRQKRWPGQRSDALCLGSLVHNALDNFAKAHKMYIDEATLTENNPTPETVALAQRLVEGYFRQYPNDLFEMEVAEKPLRFTLQPLWEGLAKLDRYFYVPKDTTIPHGLDGATLRLSRGWWAKEFKTKSAYRNRAEWIKEWQTKRQADFQILALQQFIVNARKVYPYTYDPPLTEDAPRKSTLDDNVQGVLVSVLEKPYEYIPKRKCIGCGAQYELASFAPKADGWACPGCQKVQKLTPYRPKSGGSRPEYFRLTITRTEQQLEVSRSEIWRTAFLMDQMRQRGMESVLPDRDACVNNVHRHECEYMPPHTYGGDTTGPEYVTINPVAYLGL